MCHSEGEWASQQSMVVGATTKSTSSQQELREALESTSANKPVECFRHHVESMLQRIEDVLRAKGKGGATQY
jgi:spore coat polysaccharide biosynthesis protein SpsF (cytidylyltransferase family)